GWADARSAHGCASCVRTSGGLPCSRALGRRTSPWPERPPGPVLRAGAAGPSMAARGIDCRVVGPAASWCPAQRLGADGPEEPCRRQGGNAAPPYGFVRLEEASAERVVGSR